MEHLPLMREIVSVLMESGCYFQLRLEERRRLVKYLLAPEVKGAVPVTVARKRPAAG